MKSLINRIEDFVSRLRWKAFFFEMRGEDQENEEVVERYGLRTGNKAPVVKDLIPFEKDLFKLASSIKFRRHNDAFLDKLDRDVASVNSSQNVIVPADKTGNFYEMSVAKYQSLCNKAITAEYRKAPEDTVELLNNEASGIAAKLKLNGRLQKYQRNKAFVLMKDHKDGFEAKEQTRLINPAKSSLGKVSKVIMERIATKLREVIVSNQWRGTDEVLGWFKGREDLGQGFKFISYDIESFYPSINEELLNRALKFAARYVDISDDDWKVIHHSRKSLLFDLNGEVWHRKSSIFDVTMGAYDGAETCEIVGLYMLDKVSTCIPRNNHGLYRDDGLIIVEEPNGPKLERIRKDLRSIFKEEGLKIEVSMPSEYVNFLDITMRNDGSFMPYRKDGKTTEYVHRSSNHPPVVLKHIPDMVMDRIRRLSSSPGIFESSRQYYQGILEQSGYKEFSTKFERSQERKGKRRKRRRKVIWFNPPYSVDVDTDLGRRFFGLVQRHFPSGHKYSAIFNKNTVKLAYSCLRNMESRIKAHNKKLVQADLQPENKRRCNCQDKQRCPLDGRCLTEAVVYEAQLKTNLGQKFLYIGMTANDFKTRYNQHRHTFNNPDRRASTRLSEKVWELKDRGIEFGITWRVRRKGKPFKVGDKTCDLCTTEKMEILIQSGDPQLLNRRTEIMGTCRHRKKFNL